MEQFSIQFNSIQYNIYFQIFSITFINKFVTIIIGGDISKSTA